MKRFLPDLPLVGFLALAIAAGAIFRYPLVLDDPFITYRYAQNIAQGTGFVFNAGERVLSTTTPLYALVLAAASFAYGNIPALGYWLSVISLGVCGFFVYRLAATEKRAIGGIAGGVLLVLSPALLITFGLETNFYLALATGGIYFYIERKTTVAFVLLALLTLTRNDGLVLFAVLGAHYLYENRMLVRDWRKALQNWQFLKPLVVYVAFLVPWVLFATFYFGAPFPFTLAAKIGQAQSGLWDPFAIGFVEWFGQNIIWLGLEFLLALLGVIWAIRSRSWLLLVGVWAIAHLVAYSLLGVAFYAWYVAPLIPAVCLFAGIGVQECGGWLGARGGKQKFLPIATAVLLSAVVLTLELRADVSSGMLEPSPKTEAYTRAGNWIRENTARGASVDMLEVGVIGYLDERPTYDFVGLVDPMRVPYLRAREFADGVRRRAAEYVIAIPPDDWLPEDVWFKDAYRAVHEIRVNGFYNNQPLVIYERADAGKTALEPETQHTQPAA